MRSMFCYDHLHQHARVPVASRKMLHISKQSNDEMNERLKD